MTTTLPRRLVPAGRLSTSSNTTAGDDNRPIYRCVITEQAQAQPTRLENGYLPERSLQWRHRRRTNTQTSPARDTRKRSTEQDKLTSPTATKTPTTDGATHVVKDTVATTRATAPTFWTTVTRDQSTLLLLNNICRVGTDCHTPAKGGETLGVPHRLISSKGHKLRARECEISEPVGNIYLEHHKCLAFFLMYLYIKFFSY
ncbi:unnamed protein product [Macrosiphum euphorbiae]|uniref:Uncharacterized protein n=1 Tax=Macrosiphum euphorbiae TaxID=13131 RepID=A0AAV0Y816_9HEMI|nr:unnamed protein product [Macrosiphum euphorbiae]